MPLVTRPVLSGSCVTIHGRCYDDDYAKALNYFTDGYRVHDDVTGLQRTNTHILPSPLFTPSPSTHQPNQETDNLIRDRSFLSIRQCFRMLTQLTQHSFDVFQDISTLMNQTNERIQQLQQNVSSVQYSIDNLNLDYECLSSSLISPGHPLLSHRSHVPTGNSSNNGNGRLTLDETALLDNNLILLDMDSPMPTPNKETAAITKSTLKRAWLVGDTDETTIAVLPVVTQSVSIDNHFYHFLQHKIHYYQKIPAFLDRKRITKSLQQRIRAAAALPKLEEMALYASYFRINDNQRYFKDRYSCPEYFLDQWFATQEQRLISVEHERKISKADKKKRFKLIRESQMMDRQRKSQVKQVVNWRDLFSQDGKGKSSGGKHRRKSSLKAQLRRESSSGKSVYSEEVQSREALSTSPSIVFPSSSTVASFSTVNIEEGSKVCETPISPLTEASAFSPEPAKRKEEVVDSKSTLSKVFEPCPTPNTDDSLEPVTAPVRRAPPPPPMAPSQRVLQSFNTPTKDVIATVITIVEPPPSSSVSSQTSVMPPPPPPPPPRRSILQDPPIGMTPASSTSIPEAATTIPQSLGAISVVGASASKRSSVRFTVDRDACVISSSEGSENEGTELESTKSNSAQTPRTPEDAHPAGRNNFSQNIDSSDDELDYNAPIRAPSVVLSARASRYYYRPRSKSKDGSELEEISPSLPSPPPSLPSKINFEADVTNPADVIVVVPKVPPLRPLVKPPPPPPPPKRNEAGGMMNGNSQNRLLVKSVRLQTFADVLAETSMTPSKDKVKSTFSSTEEVSNGNIGLISGVSKEDSSNEPKRLVSPLNANVDLLAAIRRGSALKKLDSTDSINANRNSAGSKSTVGDRTSGNSFANSASVQAILERRKYIQAESDSSDDSDGDEW